MCGDKNCNKKYGSNAALYTHIKTKHNGVPPPGTVRPAQSATKGQKGRPKAGEPHQSDTQDQFNESVACQICLEERNCICPESLDLDLIKLLSEESFINFIKSVGNFGENESQESTNQWVRSVDDDIKVMSEAEVRRKFE